uniref:DNA polymerase kappa n=1 Tax=Rhodotorula toruloides TaxID=5286 RepID=A0A0K3C6K6_RHOTO
MATCSRTTVAQRVSPVAGGSVSGQPGAGTAQAPSRKRAWEGEEPKASLLKRMAGPSDLKAGVGGKKTAEEVQRMIFEASKDDQQRRDKELEVKVNRLKGILASKELTATGDEEQKVDAILEELAEKRDLSRVIALIDADAFYAACHELEDSSLKGTAFGVGGGMLTTASYEARKYGCRSAMPLFIAKKLCPHIKSLKMQPDLYVAASKKIMSVLEKYGPIAPASLDEAYVDMTDYCANQGVTPTEAISRLRADVKETTGLTVSAGVSPNKSLSKIAADMNKPDGQFVIDSTAEACQAFIKGARLRKCYGIGRVTETLLNGLGLETVNDIYTYRKRLYLIRDHLGSSGVFRWLLSLYLGMGSNRVVRAKRGDRKTYGVEKTFTPTDNRDALDDTLRKVAKSLAKDLARSEFSGRTITLSIKHDTYERVTRAYTPGKNVWIRSYEDIVRLGLHLLHKEMDDRAAAIKRGEKVKGGKGSQLKARLLGLRMSNLRDEREVKRGNKLDGWVKATPSKLPDIQLSDSDSDMLHESDNSDEGECDGWEASKRQLEQLAKDAEVDPLAAEDDWDDSHGGASGSGTGRWMVVDDDDEDDVVLSGKTRSLVSRTSSLPPAPPATARRTSSSSSAGSIGAKHPASTSSAARQRSPSNSRASPTASTDSRPAKKRKTDSPPPTKPISEFTCPVCQKTLVGSETAMSGHVAQHFEAPAKKTKKKTSTSSGLKKGVGNSLSKKKR